MGPPPPPDAMMKALLVSEEPPRSTRGKLTGNGLENRDGRMLHDQVSATIVISRGPPSFRLQKVAVRRPTQPPRGGGGPPGASAPPQEAFFYRLVRIGDDGNLFPATPAEISRVEAFVARNGRALVSWAGVDSGRGEREEGGGGPPSAICLMLAGPKPTAGGPWRDSRVAPPPPLLLPSL